MQDPSNELAVAHCDATRGSDAGLGAKQDAQRSG